MSSASYGVEIERFKLDLHGEPALRLSIGLELYFPRPMDKYRLQVLEVWRRFLTWRGEDTMIWARLGGGNKSRKMTKAAYTTIESWLGGGRPYGLTCFINVENGEWEQIGDEAFRVYGNNRELDVEGGDGNINYVQVRVPLSAVDNADDLAGHLIDLAAPLDFVCGTAGLMIHATPFSRDRLWKEVRGLVTRYEGVEPDGAEDGRHSAHFGLTGVNWLTFIGARHLKTLGGKKKVRTLAADAADLTALEIGQGLVLRAGLRPHTGDRNKPSSDLGPYREVYRCVGSAMFLDEDYAFDEDDFDGEATVQWLQRFGRTPDTP